MKDKLKRYVLLYMYVQYIGVPSFRMYRKTSLETYAYEQRVDRVTGFLSSRPNWVRPNPHKQVNVYSEMCKRVCPPPLCLGGGHTLLREREWADPIRTRGQTLWYSRFSIIPLRV
jgi:hypothetical protein